MNDIENLTLKEQQAVYQQLENQKRTEVEELWDQVSNYAEKVQEIQVKRILDEGLLSEGPWEVKVPYMDDNHAYIDDYGNSNYIELDGGQNKPSDGTTDADSRIVPRPKLFEAACYNKYGNFGIYFDEDVYINGHDNHVFMTFKDFPTMLAFAQKHDMVLSTNKLQNRVEEIGDLILRIHDNNVMAGKPDI